MLTNRHLNFFSPLSGITAQINESVAALFKDGGQNTLDLMMLILANELIKLNQKAARIPLKIQEPQETRNQLAEKIRQEAKRIYDEVSSKNEFIRNLFTDVNAAFQQRRNTDSFCSFLQEKNLIALVESWYKKNQNFFDELYQPIYTQLSTINRGVSDKIKIDFAIKNIKRILAAQAKNYLDSMQNSSAYDLLSELNNGSIKLRESYSYYPVVHEDRFSDYDASSFQIKNYELIAAAGPQSKQEADIFLDLILREKISHVVAAVDTFADYPLPNGQYNIVNYFFAGTGKKITFQNHQVEILKIEYDVSETSCFQGQQARDCLGLLLATPCESLPYYINRYAKFILQVTNNKGQSSQLTVHFFKTMNNTPIRLNGNELRRFDAIKDLSTREKTLIHCTVGVGRTGFITLCFLLQYQLQSMPSKDKDEAIKMILDTLAVMRKKRPGMVVTCDQLQSAIQYAWQPRSIVEVVRQPAVSYFKTLDQVLKSK